MIKKLRKRLTVVFTAFTGAVLASVLIFSFFISRKQVLESSQFQLSLTASEIANYVILKEDNLAALTDIEQNYNAVLELTKNGSIVNFPSGYNPPTSRDYLLEEAHNTEESSEKIGQFELMVGDDGSTTWEEAQAAVESANPTTEANTQADSDVQSEAANSGTAAVASAEEEAAAAVQYPVAYGVFGHFAEDGAVSAVSLYTSLSYGETPYWEIKGQHGDNYRVISWNYKADSNNKKENNEFTFTLLQDKGPENSRIFLLALLHLAGLGAGLALLAFINWHLSKTLLKPTADGLQRQTAFVAAASHELRSPLAVIRSSLSAADSSPTVIQAKKYRQTAEDEVERMSRLVDDLLLLAGGDANTWELNLRPLDLDTLLIETHEQYLPLAKDSKMQFKLNLPDEALGETLGDQGRLQQILQILLSNAMEYSPENSTIILSCRQKKGMIEFSVIDHGPGICDADKARIFDRFYQADKSRTNRTHFGLGLSVAKELAELHGGTLSVVDTPGGGATFRLKIPRKAAHG